MANNSILDKIKEINLHAICDEAHNKLDSCFTSLLNQDLGLLKCGNGRCYYKINLKKDNDDNSITEIRKCDSGPKLEIVSLVYDNELIYLVKTNGECHYIACKGYESLSLLNSKQFTGNLAKKYVIKVSCGEQHAIFTTHAGLVFVIGSGDRGELGLEALNVVNEPTMVNQLLNYRVLDVFCGKNHNIAIGLKRDSNQKSVSNDENATIVFVWGDNTYGQLGIPKSDTHSINIPTELKEFDHKEKEKEILCVNGGLYHSYLLFANNVLYGFGDNEYKQIQNSSVNSIDKPTRIDIDSMAKGNFAIKTIRTSAYSTLLSDGEAKIILFGQISHEPVILALKDAFISMKHLFLLTDYCLYVFYSSLLSNVILYQKEDPYSLQLNQTLTSHSQNHCNSQSVKEKSSSNDENDFNALDIENDLMIDRSNTDFGFSFEKSIEELRNYISLVGISLPTSQGSETLNASTMDFRPKNLPKKSKEEEAYHRHLVEENRKHYINSIKQKQEEERKRKKRLEERKKKSEKLVLIWQKDILVNWFTAKDEYKTKKLFYEGLPSNLRGKIWSLCIGNYFSITHDYYNIEVRKAVKLLIELDDNSNNDNNENNDNKLNQFNVKVINRENSIKHIDLDIERTFPELGIFKSNSPMSNDLREILCAFVVSRPDIGYVQGISYIAAMLLINLEKFPSFVALINIILNANIIPFYRFDEASIRKRFQLFKQIFYENLPELCSHFEANEVFPEHYLIEWIMTLFARSLNVDLVARLWDIYMIEGIKTIFQAGIVLLSILEKKLLEMDFDDIMSTLKSLNTQLINEDFFIDLIQKVKIPDWVNTEIGRLNEENIPI